VDLLKQIFGGLLILAGALIIVANYARQVSNFRNRKGGRWSSPAPFVGPLFLIVGYNALPLPMSDWIFIVALVDPDTVIVVLSVPLLIIRLLRREGT
jgi:hypothetical protein